MSWIVGLMVLGFGLIMLEIFIPGGIVGVFGGLCLLGAIWLSFDSFGADGALISFLVAVVGVVACLYVEFKILPKTKAGQRLFLQDRVSGESQAALGDESLIGQTGKTLTVLSPSGYIVVDGRKLEGYSKSGYLEKGQKIKVESFDQFRVIVSKI